jgi:hypothetical protein
MHKCSEKLFQFVLNHVGNCVYLCQYGEGFFLVIGKILGRKCEVVLENGL